MPKRDYYGDGEDTPPPKSPNPEAGDSEEEGSATAMIPKSLLAGKTFEVGDSVVLKIVKMYEDEVEVEYASGEEGESEEAETESPMPEQGPMSPYMQ